MFNHLLDVFDIRKTVSKFTGLDNDAALSTELTKFMNGQWWYSFNTGDRRIKGFLKVIELLEESIQSSSRQFSTADNLTKKGLALTKEESYRPGVSHTLRGIFDK